MHGNVYLLLGRYIYVYIGVYEHGSQICKDSNQFDSMGVNGGWGGRKGDMKVGGLQKEKK